MRLAVWSPKGGVGKSSISTALQQLISDCQIITNDKMNPYGLVFEKELYYLIQEGAEIPIFDESSNLIYDFGGYGDKRIIKFIQETQIKIIIPFNPDLISFQSAISIYNEIKSIDDNIIFILNRAKKGDIDIFSEQMKKLKINKPLYELKESKFFSNLFNKNQKIKEIKSDSLLSYSYKTVLEQLEKILKEIKR